MSPLLMPAEAPLPDEDCMAQQVCDQQTTPYSLMWKMVFTHSQSMLSSLC